LALVSRGNDLKIDEARKRKEFKMFEEIRSRKASLGFVWVKASDTGSTYLFPASHVGHLRTLSERELSEYGVDESTNPQND
jgi:hypothetical protein